MTRRRFLLAVAIGLAATACGGLGDVPPGDAPPGDAPPGGGAEPGDVPKGDFVLERPLGWLASVQRADGSWSADDAPPGAPADEVSATSLALLAFLDAGYTNRSGPPFGTVVGRGFVWLKSAQDEDGRFLPRDRPSSARHDALASAALVGAYGMTGSPLFLSRAQRALDALVASGATWPPERAEANAVDLDAFGWAVPALGTARRIAQLDAEAGKEPTFRVDDRVLEPARAWLDAALGTPTEDPSLLATRVVVRSAIGRGVDDLAALRRDVVRLSAHPVPDVPEDDLPARVAALARMGSLLAGSACIEAWRRRGRAWLDAARHFDADGDGLGGSCDDRGPLALRTGRVEATAYAALAEPPVCTAYLPRFPGTEPEPEPATAPAAEADERTEPGER